MTNFKLVLTGLFLFLISSVFAHGEKYVLFENGNKIGLRNEKGETLIPAQYQNLGWSNGDNEVLDHLIGFRINDKWGLMNIKNEIVLSPQYLSIVPHHKDVLIVSKKQSTNNQVVYQLINFKGKAISDHTFHELKTAEKNIIAVQKNWNNYKYGVINDKGNVVIPIKYNFIKTLGPNLYEVEDDNYKSGILNNSGDLVTPFELDSVRYTGKYVVFFKNGKAGVSSATGEIIKEATYRNVLENNGHLKAEFFSKWHISDSTYHINHAFDADSIYAIGEEVIHLNINNKQSVLQLGSDNSDTLNNDIISLNNNLAIFKEGRHLGVRDLSGNTIVKAIYDSIITTPKYIIAHNDLYEKQGWYLLSHKGVIKTKDPYNQISPLSDQYLLVEKNNFYGIINKWGDIVLDCRYEAIGDVCGDFFKVKFYNEVGIKDKYGEWKLLPAKQQVEFPGDSSILVRTPEGSFHESLHGNTYLKYDGYLYPTNDGIYKIKDYYHGFGFTDQGGNMLVYPEFDEISPLLDNTSYVAQKEGTYTFISKNGIITHKNDNRFEEIVGLSEAFMGVKIDGKYGFVDLEGNLRVSNQYQNIGLFHEGMAPIEIRDSWGFIDKLEDIIVQPFYDTVMAYHQHVAVVVKHNKYGLIDENGQYMLRPEFDKIELLPNGLYSTEKGGKIGLVSRSGHTIVLPRFNSIQLLENNWMIVERSHKYGVINDEGVDIIPMIYNQIIYNPYSNNYFLKKSSYWKTLDI